MKRKYLSLYSGCISEMWINHKLVDFSNAAKMHRVTPGCSSGEEEPDDEARRNVIEPSVVSAASSMMEASMQQEHVAHDPTGKSIN